MQFFNRQILLSYASGDRTGYIPATGSFADECKYT